MNAAIPSGRAPGHLARLLRATLRAYLWVVRVAGARAARPPRASLDVLLTGTFHSRNWVLAHVRPMTMAAGVGKVVVVSSAEPLDLPKLEWIVPSRLLARCIGSAPARLATFFWVALRRRPDYIGGFHLLFNGLAAVLLGKLLRTRSLYLCVGGPAEVERGGLWSENKVFQRLPAADAAIEQLLLRAVGHADLVVTMGTSAAEFYRRRSGARCVVVHPGGLDLETLPVRANRDVDLLFVGRLAPIKRLDLFVDIVAAVKGMLPEVRAVIVGEGPVRSDITRHVERLQLGANVTLVGFQPDVRSWLARSKVLLLTSDSEGLSLAVMEAMACGVPVAVRNVGDLPDLVHDGVNGYLLDSADPASFAARIQPLLVDRQQQEQFSAAAVAAAQTLDVRLAAEKWSGFFANVATRG